ncbi:glycosyltransferase [Massilibacteroides vaginae]|uniref:glycosyltransferase n=1 Tax=Massilibacteroides vaginae TaxID=1673718 RepID=UPI000A1CF30E|nr:glycosyltransferase [Massilibacteroides vaginae]
MTILFDIYPAIGHLNASFALVTKSLKEQHRIVYCAEKEHETMIKSRGFECVIQDYPIEPDKQELRIKGMLFILECLISAFSQNRKNVFFRKIADWENKVKELSPDLVYLDAQCAMRTALYHNLKIPVISVETMPLSLYDPWVPPFTSGLIPKQTFFSKLRICLAWKEITLKRKMRNIFFSVLLFNQDYFSIYKKLFVKYNFPYNEKLDLKRPFVIGIKDVEILAMTPASFDFPRKYPPKCQYAPSRVDLKREEYILNKRYLQVIKNIHLLKQKRPDTKIIYCASGTVRGFEKRSKIIFNKIRNISLRNPQFVFILSVGKCHNTSYLLPLPSNMYVFQQVPQLHLLTYCDLMITLGGMNSIAECIEKEVPMLVCPMSLKTDQLGNSARVVYHNLGLRARIKWDSSRKIEKKIVQILENHAVYKQNSSIMKEKILNESTPIYTQER